jgi:hypothetical protein
MKTDGWSDNRFETFVKQEGHDGPEVAHLYIGPRSGPV